MIFLGAWAFFSIGALAGGRHSIPTGLSSPIGRVLAVKTLHTSTQSHMSYDMSLNSLLTQQWSERVIGRIFAWLCTTLYLTSRLPQIWKNVRSLLILFKHQYTHHPFLSLLENLSRSGNTFLLSLLF
jgi:hypothetical protein